MKNLGVDTSSGNDRTVAVLDEPIAQKKGPIVPVQEDHVPRKEKGYPIKYLVAQSAQRSLQALVCEEPPEAGYRADGFGAGEPGCNGPVDIQLYRKMENKIRSLLHVYPAQFQHEPEILHRI